MLRPGGGIAFASAEATMTRMGDWWLCGLWAVGRRERVLEDDEKDVTMWLYLSTPVNLLLSKSW
jgi:hypothetical protein